MGFRVEIAPPKVVQKKRVARVSSTITNLHWTSISKYYIILNIQKKLRSEATSSRKQTVKNFGETSIGCRETNSEFENELWQAIPVLLMGGKLQHLISRQCLQKWALAGNSCPVDGRKITALHRKTISCFLVLTLILHGSAQYWPVHPWWYWKIIRSHAVPCHVNCVNCSKCSDTEQPWGCWKWNEFLKDCAREEHEK